MVSDKFAQHPNADKIRLKVFDYSGLDPSFLASAIQELVESLDRRQSSIARGRNEDMKVHQDLRKSQRQCLDCFSCVIDMTRFCGSYRVAVGVHVNLRIFVRIPLDLVGPSNLKA